MRWPFQRLRGLVHRNDGLRLDLSAAGRRGCRPSKIEGPWCLPVPFAHAPVVELLPVVGIAAGPDETGMLALATLVPPRKLASVPSKSTGWPPKVTERGQKATEIGV